MIDVAEVIRLSSLGLAIALSVGIVVVSVGAAIHWAVDQIRRPWNRLLRAVDFTESSRVIAGDGDPRLAVEEAWRLHARTRPYSGRTASRFRVATAMADGMLGAALASATQWEDALAHLLPAIARLRGVPDTKSALARFLQDAAVAQENLGDRESALALVDESLDLLRPLGRRRWRTPEYLQGLRLRIAILRELRRLDEAIRMAAEVVTAAPKDKTVIGPVLTAYAETLLAAGRAEEALETVSVAVQHARGGGKPGQIHSAVRTLGLTLFRLERYDESADVLREAADVSAAVADGALDGDGDIATLDRILYAGALIRSGRIVEAGQALDQAAQTLSESTNDFYPLQNHALFSAVRAEVLEQEGRPVEAVAAARLGHERLTELDRMRPGGWYADEFADLNALRKRLEGKGHTSRS